MDKIFSGTGSVQLWAEINDVKTIEDLKYALYHTCCKLQELEDKIDNQIKRQPNTDGMFVQLK